MNGLRLLYLHNGTLTYDSLFLNRLSQDYETFLVTFRNPTQSFNPKVGIIRLPGFHLQAGGRKVEKLLVALATLRRVVQIRICIRDMKPQVIVGNWVTTYGLYAKLSKWRPFVLFAYGSDIVVEAQLSPFHRAISISVIRGADLVLIDSEVQRKALISLGCAKEKIICFPWFDENSVRNVAPDSTLRARLGWENNVVVVCVRKHEPLYSVDTLIRAIPTVLRHAPNVRFLIFGNGTETSRLIRLAHDLNVFTSVHFAGNVDRHDLLKFVKDCDIYVSTSLTDGSSSSLLEAMWLGVPVVVTSIEGNKEWITDGVNGVMFPPRDFAQLARILVELERQRESRARLKQAASATVEERVDWKASSAALVSRIRELYLSWKTLHEQDER